MAPAVDPPVDSLTALSAQFDPLRALSADETDLYVDWQVKLDIADDVKRRLANSIARSPGPIARLFTGHRGAGKTTELNRVRQRLQDGSVDGRRVFVSMLSAERWLDLNDVQPEDLVFQIVRQLVSDLKQAGFTIGESRLRGALDSLRGFFQRRVAPESVEVGVDPLRVSFRLEEFPAASRRREFRELLAGLLPTIYDLTNTEILRQAREWLAAPEHGGYAEIAIIVDQLDRIPRKPLHDYTNHENLFLDHAGRLRALNCDVLYTIPIELAYSRACARLQDVYGGTILTLPAIPVRTRDGADFPEGVAVARDRAPAGDQGRRGPGGGVRRAGPAGRGAAPVRRPHPGTVRAAAVHPGPHGGTAGQPCDHRAGAAPCRGGPGGAAAPGGLGVAGRGAQVP